jgi:CRP-like cAMP-binding protein
MSRWELYPPQAAYNAQDRKQAAFMPISLVRKLEQFTPLSEPEKRVLQAALTRARDVLPHGDIVSEGDCPTDLSLVSEGFACRYKLLGDGRRQITAFLIPGDNCDLRAFLLGRMDHAVAALSRCHVSHISHAKLSEIIEKHPRIGFGLWRDTMHDGAIYRQWLTNVGRRSAYQRIAHLLCEVWWRLQAVGRTHGDSYELPVTQTDIGDAMGLSVVHVNRTLQQLRAEGLISLQSNVVMVLDWRRLQEAGEFDPAYLQLQLETTPLQRTDV